MIPYTLKGTSSHNLLTNTKTLKEVLNDSTSIAIGLSRLVRVVQEEGLGLGKSKRGNEQDKY